LHGVKQVDVETRGTTCDYIYSPEHYIYTGLDNSMENQDFVTTAAADCCLEVERVTYTIGTVWNYLSYVDETVTTCHGSYSWEFDTTGLSDGYQILDVDVHDFSGHIVQAWIPVIIDNASHSTPEPTPAIIYGTGDVDSDGETDIVDALLVAQYYVLLHPENFDPGQADVDNSGVINIVDALLIAQYYVKLIEEFPGY
jgi:hypothetical protein